MILEIAFAPGYGIKHPADTVRDIVTHNILYNQYGKKNPEQRVCKRKNATCTLHYPFREKYVSIMNGILHYHCCNSTCQSDNKTEQVDNSLLLGK